MRYNPSIYLDNMNTGGQTNVKTHIHIHTSVPLLLCSCNLMHGADAAACSAGFYTSSFLLAWSPEVKAAFS